MIIIKKNTARAIEKTVHRILIISNGINHDSVVRRIEVFSKGIAVVRDVKEKENVFV
jgi:hypothetical protein